MTHFPRVKLSGVCLLACLGGAAACSFPGRDGLPSPFPLTHGATPVPADGVGAGVELGEGLQGPDRERADVLTLFLAGGIANRISASYATFQDRTSGDLRGDMWRLKLRPGGAFGPNTGVQLGFARMSRTLYGGQHDRLRSVDMSIPMDFPLTTHRSPYQFSLLFGPRLTFERYTDLLDPARSVNVTYIGTLGGAHLSWGVMHMFAEATLTRVPTGPGESWSRRVVLLPSVGLMFRAGSASSRPTSPQTPE